MAKRTDPPPYAVLLAGGSGSRLWPVSRELYPKQIAKFIGRESLIQTTLRRVVPPFRAENVRVVCGARHFHEIARHMAEIGVPPEGRIIAEPVGRNTAPAILLAALRILAEAGDAVLGVFPADHVIRDLPAFHARLAAALELAAAGRIVTFGIAPKYPETGYGYVEGGAELPGNPGALAVRRFVEKPDLKTARRYVAAGNFFWNSGMFAFRASVIREEFGRLHPQMLAALEPAAAGAEAPGPEAYAKLPDLSIDVAVMEKTDRGVVLPSDFGWSDIGSWKSLYDFLPKDADGNVLDGDVVAQESRNCLVLGNERLIAVNRLANTVVVETPDSIFVSDIEASREVKSIVAELKRRGRAETEQHLTMHFPWGARTLLEERDGGGRLSRLMLYPGAQAVLDAAPGERVHLLALEGRARVASGRRRRELAPGDSFTTATGAGVRLANAGAGRLQLFHAVLPAARPDGAAED
jgi:mannose-1-phosphate guanylyltransferase/mannose-6-phosphate isomerase